MLDVMSAERLLAISAHWSCWERDVPKAVRRRIPLPRRLSDSLALVVQGVRRCGKSTLLARMMGHYRLDPRHRAFLNFEDPRLGQPLDHSVLDAWVTAFRRLHPRLKKPSKSRWLRVASVRPCAAAVAATSMSA